MSHFTQKLVPRRVSTASMARYADLSREELVARLEALELDHPAPAPAAVSSSSTNSQPLPRSKAPVAAGPSVKKPKQPKKFDFSAHPTRHVALLLTYHGWPYSGLAIQTDSELATVEGELLKALEKTHLIDSAKGFEGCEYSRCGRTDRGVSGEGQVVNLYVRSCRKGGIGWRAEASPSTPAGPATEDLESADERAKQENVPEAGPSTPPSAHPKAKVTAPAPALVKKEAENEFPYPRLLNGVLPPSIRVVAWSPVEPDFSSRFSCSYRHYKYPFHMSPSLDLSLMRRAAGSLVGEHDFRNFCKLDGSKQILNHSRRVVEAYFDEGEEEAAQSGMVVFNLIGTAFLWHQVRHVIGALFLIGRGLEEVGLISELLDVERNPSKPNYHMGDPLPLTLHECGYPEPLDWRIGGYDGPLLSLTSAEREGVMEKAMEGRDKLERELEAMTQHAELRSWQVGGALRTLRKIAPKAGDRAGDARLSVYPIGGGEVITTGKYKKVMDRPRGDTPDVVNRKWREAKERQAASASTAG